LAPAGGKKEDPMRRLHGTQYWRRRARLQLIHYPLCAMCLQRGVTTPATVADHVTPHHGDPNSFILGELQSLCTPCHSGRKQSIEKRYDTAAGVDGWPLDPNHPVYQQ